MPAQKYNRYKTPVEPWVRRKDETKWMKPGLTSLRMQNSAFLSLKAVPTVLFVLLNAKNHIRYSWLFLIIGPYQYRCH